MIGVRFGQYHSYTQWKLVLQSSTIGLPEVKTVTVDVPGMDGVLDYTELLTGGPVYGLRTLSFEFLMPEDASTWSDVLSDIAAKIHGKKLDVIRDSDINWRYTGRVYVRDFTAAERLGKLTIDVEADPYKISRLDSGVKSL